MNDELEALFLNASLPHRDQAFTSLLTMLTESKKSISYLQQEVSDLKRRQRLSELAAVRTEDT